MGAVETAPAPDRLVEVRQRLLPALRREGLGFRLGLAGAVLAHALLIVGVSRAPPRMMGERDGSPEGISVELVDEADLQSLATVQPPQPAAPPVQPPAPPPEPQREPQRDPAEQAQPAPPAPDPALPAVRPAEPKKNTAPPAPRLDAPGISSLPDLADISREATPAPKSKSAPAKQPAPPLQLALPSLPSMAPNGRGAAVSRPPGITRSGENDEFGRGVIRALRQTMPPPRGQLGRVTIRLLLSDKGNIVEVQLINSGGDPILDQSVVFAARQASFPLPPVAASVADRTFLVTYVYR